jgi:hypothetical protein
MEFKIEKNIPVAPRGGSSTVYPFGQMEPGDSFLILGDEIAVHRARCAASWWAKRKNQSFAVRKTPEGFRCWRIA